MFNNIKFMKQENLQHELEVLHKTTDCEHVRNEVAQLLTIVYCGTDINKIKERAEAVLAGLIHTDRGDK